MSFIERLGIQHPIIQAPMVGVSTPVPGHGATFTDFASPVAASGGVAFLGLVDNAVAGVYRLAGGALSLIADAATPVPGGAGHVFAAFTPPALDGDTAAFAAFGRFDGQSSSSPRSSQTSSVGR